MELHLRELSAALNSMVDGMPEHQNPVVAVVLKEPSVGPVATVKVAGVSLGFDWESGMLLVRTTEPIQKAK